MSKLPPNVTVLGDPHLGRQFKTGVPLHRIGDREKSVWHDFEQSLMSAEPVGIHVNMGDLFDKFVVTPEVVLRAAEIYIRAARRVENTLFVVIEGNHDRSKDSSKQSSFDIFAALVSHQGNIMVVQEEPWIIGNLGFVPYHPFVSAEELVRQLPDNLNAVFGHWDIVDYGGHNVIPTKLIRDMGIPLAVSGHDHLARTERRHDVDIIVTGSMQPYTHAEDNTGELYWTGSIEDLEEIDPTDKNIRILLREGESLPVDLNCLSLTAKRITDEDEKLEVDTSEFESLDLPVMLKSALSDLSICDEVMSRFE